MRIIFLPEALDYFNELSTIVSPFASFIYSDSIIVDTANYGVGQSLFNFGGMLSAGYYLLPNLSVGAYYKYNFHNTNIPDSYKKQQHLPVVAQRI